MNIHGADFAIKNPVILSALVQSALTIKTGDILTGRIESLINVTQIGGRR